MGGELNDIESAKQLESRLQEGCLNYLNDSLHFFKNEKISDLNTLNDKQKEKIIENIQYLKSIDVCSYIKTYLPGKEKLIDDQISKLTEKVNSLQKIRITKAEDISQSINRAYDRWRAANSNADFFDNARKINPKAEQRNGNRQEYDILIQWAKENKNTLTEKDKKGFKAYLTQNFSSKDILDWGFNFKYDKESKALIEKRSKINFDDKKVKNSIEASLKKNRSNRENDKYSDEELRASGKNFLVMEAVKDTLINSIVNDSQLALDINNNTPKAIDKKLNESYSSQNRAIIEQKSQDYPDVKEYFAVLPPEEQQKLNASKNFGAIIDVMIQHKLPPFNDKIKNLQQGLDNVDKIQVLRERFERLDKFQSLLQGAYGTVEEFETFIKKVEKKVDEQLKDKKLDPLDRKKYVLAKAYELAINDKNLSEEKRKQIKNLSLDFYEQTKDFVEFDQIRSKEMLEEVKTLSYQKYQEQTQETPKNTTFDKMKDKLLTPEAMNVLFDKNPNYQKYQIGEETFKDVPEESMLKFNKAIIPEGLKKFFDEKGDLNPEEVKKAKPEEKKNLDEFQKNRINDTKSELAKDTNETVKVQAINICMDTLKSMFDITVENKGEVENWMKSFETANTQGANKLENTKLTIKGSIKGKEIMIKYDLATGKLSTKQFLDQQTKGQKGSDFVVNSDTALKDIDAITMPTIGDVLSASKNIDYTNAVVNAQGDKNIYKREIEKSIYTDIESKLPKTEKKDIFEQELLKIMTIQEYLKMMNIDQKGAWKVMKSQPMSHELFQYLYESVQTYSKQDLISMRDTISKYQERETQQASATNIPANKEMTVIRKLTLDKQQKSKDPGYKGETYFDLMNLIRNEDEFKKGNHILSLKKFAAFVERSTLDNVDYTKLDAKYNQDIGQIVSKYKAQQESEKFNKKEAMTAQLADVELDEALQGLT